MNKLIAIFPKKLKVSKILTFVFFLCLLSSFLISFYSSRETRSPILEIILNICIGFIPAYFVYMLVEYLREKEIHKITQYIIQNILDQYIKVILFLYNGKDTHSADLSNSYYAFPPTTVIAEKFDRLDENQKLAFLTLLEDVNIFTIKQLEKLYTYMPFLDATLIKAVSNFEKKFLHRFTDPKYNMYGDRNLNSYELSVQTFAREFNRYVSFCHELEKLSDEPFVLREHYYSHILIVE